MVQFSKISVAYYKKIGFANKKTALAKLRELKMFGRDFETNEEFEEWFRDRIEYEAWQKRQQTPSKKIKRLIEKIDFDNERDNTQVRYTETIKRLDNIKRRLSRRDTSLKGMLNRNMKEKVGAVREKKVLQSNINNVYTIFLDKKVPVNETTVDYIAVEAMKILTTSKAYYIQQNKVNLNNASTTIRLIYAADGDRHFSDAFMNVKNKDDFISKLTSRTQKNYDTSDYMIHWTSAEILINKHQDKGGCSNNRKNKPENLYQGFKVNKDFSVNFPNRINQKKFKCQNYIQIRTYKSTNNNCIFGVINQFYNVKGNVVKPDKVREELGLKKNTSVDYKVIPKIIEWYNKKFNKKYGYMVLNNECKIILQNLDECKKGVEYVKLYLRNGHYWGYTPVVKNNCKECGREYVKNHVCDDKRKLYYQAKQQKLKYVHPRKVEEKTKTNYDDIFFFDFETFQPNYNHVPYAVGYKHKNVYKEVYGKDTLSKFMDDIVKLENTTICAYNGSSFDFYFVFEDLAKRGVKIGNTIYSNGKLLALEFGKGNKVFDLCCFVNSSLDRACSDFQIKNAKSTFEHSKMKTWDDVIKYENEVRPYMKLDVLALEELYIKFNDMMYDLFKTNISSYITLSNMGYSIWQSLLNKVDVDKQIEIPNELKKYNFIKQATFGGRCYPMQRNYKSENYDDICSKNMTYEKILENNKFIFNADATSLYPASMKGFDLCEVKYPIGFSTWNNEPKKMWKENKTGFYEIDFKCPRDITVPILPRKKYQTVYKGKDTEKNINIGIEWSLLDGRGVYTSVDIQNAIDAGYTVRFIGECLVWNNTGDIFSTYIDKFYKMKEDAETENNKVKRSIAKLFLNSLYGKTLQRAIFSKTVIANNVHDFNEFCSKHDLTDFQVMNEKLLITGESKDREMQITKPCQLGAFVTAYSRRIMLTYIKVVDPSLKKHCFTYTDTDSLHITGEGYKKLLAKGMIKTKAESSLGYLCSDIDNEGLIISEKNLAPKTYKYEYINNKNELCLNEKATMKCKGIPNRVLSHDIYDNETQKKLKFKGLKKLGKTVCSKDSKKGLKNFNIKNSKQKRTFLKTEWSGMTLVGNMWYPIGYDIKLIK